MVVARRGLVADKAGVVAADGGQRELGSCLVVAKGGLVVAW